MSIEALVDNDLVYKLARYDLLIEFERLLALRSFAQPHGRIATAPYALKLMKNPVVADWWPDARQADALRGFLLKRCRPVTGTRAAALTALNVEALDPGEVTLVAYALEHESALIFTGDKRALRAIAQQPSLTGIAAALDRRFVHLSMVARRLSKRLGWERVRAAVVKCEVDIDLYRLYLLPKAPLIETGLDGSIARLRSETGTLLMTDF